MTLSEKIAKLRRRHGWSQEELAEKMDVSRQAVSKWEGGQALPDLDKLVRLSTLFGVSTDYLLKDEAEPSADSSPDGEITSPPVDAADQAPVASSRVFSLDEAVAYLDTRRRASRLIAVATLLCVLSPIPLIFLGVASEFGLWGLTENSAGGIGLVSLFLVVMCAVALFVYCGFQNAPYEFLDKAEPFELSHGVREMVTARKQAETTAYVRTNILATCLCILSPLPLLIGMFTERELLTVALLCVTMATAGIGALLFIWVGVRHAATQKLLKEGDFTPIELKKTGVREIIGFIYWGILTAVFLLWSFLSNDWSITWLVFAVGGVLFPVVMALCTLLLDRKNKP